jgi:ABC-type ATPase with predicted acetyltransferase domain
MSSASDRAFIHALYQKHYANRPEPVQLEACIRCGRKGKLGQRKPYAGLCKACRGAEYRREVEA